MEITKELYKKALASDGVLKDGNVELLSFLFFAPQCEATAPQLTEALGYGDKPGPANAILGNLGKRIAKDLGVILPERENSSPGWWQLIAHGEQRDEGFVWLLRENLADALIELDLLNDAEAKLFPEVVQVDSTFYEGKTKIVTVNSFERNPIARKLCIKHYGSKCAVCGLEFEYFYGDIGEGFIHVHHLKEISSVGKEYKINPVEDLRPVCPNCHAMLHQKKPAFSIEELQGMIGKTHNNTTKLTK
jgi:5-methylcytosine-specific restriction protein A